MYKGFWATFWRDVPGWGVYFYAYEGLKVLVSKNLKPEQRKKHDVLIRLMSGGLAGQLSWIVTYPFDVIKTRMMCDNSPNTPTLRKNFVLAYKENGLRYFFKGLAPTLLRSFPSNAVVLCVFDLISEYFD